MKIKKIFWLVAVKPGKPAFFGRKRGKLVFALPGNPVSVLVTFLEFVSPAILKMMRQRDVILQEREAISEVKFPTDAGREYTLK